VVVAAYRDTDAAVEGFSDVVGRLARDRTTTRLRLGGLDEDGVSQLIGATTGLRLSPRVVSRVLDLTDGNPLYIGEAARLLESEGALGGVLEVDRLELPRDVRATVLRRVSLLSPACQEVLKLASVLGRDFPLDALTLLAGDDLDVVAALDEATAPAIVVDSPTRPDHLRFAHAVLSEALYREIPSLRRRRIHADAGLALESLTSTTSDGRVAELARHYFASLPVGPVDRAVRYARLAGERAVRQLAYEEGARLFAMALQAAAAATPPPSIIERTELLLDLGDAQAKGGETPTAKATFLEAADLARQSGDSRQFARAALGYGGRFVWLRAGTDPKVIPLLREALDALPESDSELRVRLLARLSGARRDESDRAPRDALSAEAVAMAGRLGEPATLAYALIARSMAIWGPDAAHELVALAAEAVRLADLAQRPDDATAARLIHFEGILGGGPGELVRPAVEDYRRHAVELRQPSHLWYSEVMWTVILLLEGELEEAETAMADAYAAGMRAQSWDAGATHLLALSMLRWEQGRLGELEEQLVSGRSMYPGYRLFRCLLPLACLETHRVDEARSLTAELVLGGETLMPLDNNWLFGMTILAEVVARVGGSDLAGALYDALAPFHDLLGAGGGEVASGSIHRPLGQMASLLGRHDDALTHFASARAVHRAYRADIWITHTDLDEAIARLRRGTGDDQGTALKLLADVRATSERRGWAALETRANAALADLDRAKPSTELPGGLTRREVEVARLVAQGRSNREIAETFVLSERTVESHVQHILTKLSFTSRAEIAAWSVRVGLDATT
jgi:DNA-binding NarL/FixJ family response regulator